MPSSICLVRLNAEKVRKKSARESVGMAHVRKVPRLRARGGYAWQVRYRDPDRVERSRTFPTRDQADRFARKVEVSKDEGTYLDPSLGKTPFGEWAKEWLESVEPGLKPSTLSGYRTLLRKHIDPAFDAPLAKIRPIDVRRFVAQLSNDGMSASRLLESPVKWWKLTTATSPL